jgi:hypothetical protein
MNPSHGEPQVLKLFAQVQEKLCTTIEVQSCAEQPRGEVQARGFHGLQVQEHVQRRQTLYAIMDSLALHGLRT